MIIHAFTTGHVQITERWMQGDGSGPRRLANALLDRRMTPWLPIWCFVIEHPAGLLVVDTGIPADANRPRYLPPHMLLVQRAARFRVTPADELGPQMEAAGLDPAAVRHVILTHLHQDHEGGLGHFPNAEFLVSRAEWQAAQGWRGRMAGYLNQRWPAGFSPTLVDFNGPALGPFSAAHWLHADLALVPTPGHSAGHLSVIWQRPGLHIIFAGDAAYTAADLASPTLDGVSVNLPAAAQSRIRLLDYTRSSPSVVLAARDPAAPELLVQTQAADFALH